MLGKVSSINDELVPVTIAGPTDGSTNIVRRDLNQDYQLPLAIDDQYGAGYLGLTSLNKVLYNPVTGILTVDCVDSTTTHVDIQETVECSIDRQILIQHIDEDGNLVTQPECGNAFINTKCQVGIDGDGNPIYQTVLKVESICADHYCGLSGVEFEEANEDTPAGSVLFYDGSNDDGIVTIHCSDRLRYDPVSSTIVVPNGLVVDDGFTQTTFREGCVDINAGEQFNFKVNNEGVLAQARDGNTFATIGDGIASIVTCSSSLSMSDDGIESNTEKSVLCQTDTGLSYCVQDDVESSCFNITSTIADICTNTVHLNTAELCVSYIPTAVDVEFTDNKIPFVTWNAVNEKVYTIDGLYYDATSCTLNVCHIQSDTSLCQGTDDNYNCLNLSNALALCHYETDCCMADLCYNNGTWCMTTCTKNGQYYDQSYAYLSKDVMAAVTSHATACVSSYGMCASWHADSSSPYNCVGSVILGTCPLRNNNNQPVEAYTYVCDVCSGVSRWACFCVLPTGLHFRNSNNCYNGYCISLGGSITNTCYVECTCAMEVCLSSSVFNAYAALKINEDHQFEWYKCVCCSGESYPTWHKMYEIPTVMCEVSIGSLATLKELGSGQNYFITFSSAFNFDSGGSVSAGATSVWYKPSSGSNKMIVCPSNGYGMVIVDWNGSTFTRQSSVPHCGTMYGTANSTLINVCGVTANVM